MSRTLASLAGVAVLAACAFSAGSGRAEAAVLVGVADQTPAMFSQPLFTQLNVKRSRIFPAWNVALHHGQARALDEWLNAARAAGVEPLVSFSQTLGSRCPRKPCKLPTVREFTRAFRAFRKRWRFVRVVSPWNEANHRSQPTFKNPKRAAQYYNVVRKLCRGCRIVAADVIDETNMERWLSVFRRTAIRPRLWGLHNYRDTNRRRGQKLGGTRRLVKAVKGEIWLTETGGLARFVLPGGGTLFPFSLSRQNKAVKRMFSLARRYRSRIKRLYIYNWFGQTSRNRFDAGLVNVNGTARPAYNTVQRTLRTSAFNP
jgi:Glycosyl hydrolase catalytic core